MAELITVRLGQDVADMLGPERISGLPGYSFPFRVEGFEESIQACVEKAEPCDGGLMVTLAIGGPVPAE